MSAAIVSTPAARRAFVLANTQLRSVPHAPEISLHVADEATPLWLKTEEELGAIGLPPPFWAFAWAGGQALARYVLDNPATVRNRQVLDFASGSGLVGIAAAKAGAASVASADIDPFALEAMDLNAAANGVSLASIGHDQIGMDAGWGTVLAGDIFYERELAGRVLAWLASLAARGATVLVGDPGRAYLPKDRLTALITYAVPVTRDLEDLDIKKTTVWQLRP